MGRKVNVVQSKKFASCCAVPASYQKIANKLNFANGEIAFICNRFRDRATERLNAMGIGCHRPPEEAYDEYGAMLDVFAKQPGDYHGNASYGRMMLEKVLRETDALA